MIRICTIGERFDLTDLGSSFGWLVGMEMGGSYPMVSTGSKWKERERSWV